MSSWWSSSLVNTIVWSVFLLMGMAQIPLLVQLWRLRTLEPIKWRRPPLLLLGCGGVVLYQIVLVLSRLFSSIAPVYIIIPITNTVSAITIEAFMLITLSLYLAFQKSNWQCRSMANLPNEAANRKALFRRIRVFKILLSTKFGFGFMIVNSSLMWGVMAVFVVNNPEVRKVTYANKDSSERYSRLYFDMLRSTFSIIMVPVMALLVLSFKMRTVTDAFGTKRALKGVAKVTMIAFMVYALTEKVLVSVLGEYIDGVDAIPILLINKIIVWKMVFVPIRTAMTTSAKVDDSHAISSRLVIEEFLTRKVFYEAFKEYLISEHSVENLLFFSDAKAFTNMVLEMSTDDRENKDIAKLWEMAKDIYNVYLKVDSPLEVNIPEDVCLRAVQKLAPYDERLRAMPAPSSHRRSSLLSQIVRPRSPPPPPPAPPAASSPSSSSPVPSYNSFSPVKVDECIATNGAHLNAELFQEAMLSVLRLMQTHSLRRFKKTPAGKQAWTTFTQEKAEEKIMRGALLVDASNAAAAARTPADTITLKQSTSAAAAADE